MARGTITCTCCGKDKVDSNYYSTQSYIYKNLGRFSTCKDCIWDYVIDENGNTDVEKMKDMLQMLDKPFLSALLEASEDEAKKANKNIFKLYMKNLGLPQNRHLRWKDGDSNSNIKPSSVKVNENDVINANTVKELNIKWGKGFSKDDLEYLENFYFEYESAYKTDTPAQKNLYKNIAKAHLQAEKELAQGNIKNYKDLMDLSSKLHNDGNIKPIQSTGANDDRGLSTYGLWIKTIEQDEPCEYFEDKPLYEDHDKLKKYWEKWFVRPFKNIFNISKDFNVRDDD